MFRKLLHERLTELGLQRILPPPSWKNDDFLENGVYLVIPERLWNLVLLAVGGQRFSDLDRQREFEIARAAGESHHNVAIRNEEWITHADLAPLGPVPPESIATAVPGKSQAQAKHLARQATERLAAIHGPRRGYLGWLLTNPVFLQEHANLLQMHGKLIEVHGFPKPRLSSVRIPEQAMTTDESWAKACCQFYIRWRLQSLVLPDLPLPLPFQIPVIDDPATGTPQEGLVRASVPDIYPVRGRGLIDDTFEDALRGQGAPDHLREWFEIVKQPSTTANVLPMYGRWFRLQHYWRLLHRRYPEPLRRKKGALIQAFTVFLEARSVDTVKSDLRRITARLDAEWERR